MHSADIYEQQKTRMFDIHVNESGETGVMVPQIVSTSPNDWPLNVMELIHDDTAAP